MTEYPLIYAVSQNTNFVLVILNCLFKTGNSGIWKFAERLVFSDEVRIKKRHKIIPQPPPTMEAKGPPCQRDLLQMPLLSSACFYLQEKLVSMKTFHYLLLILHFFLCSRLQAPLIFIGWLILGCNQGIFCPICIKQRKKTWCVYCNKLCFVGNYFANPGFIE